jgi:predicted  nucleic acid-binding Zn ribbon protein
VNNHDVLNHVTQHVFVPRGQKGRPAHAAKTFCCPKCKKDFNSRQALAVHYHKKLTFDVSAFHTTLNHLWSYQGL